MVQSFFLMRLYIKVNLSKRKANDSGPGSMHKKEKRMKKKYGELSKEIVGLLGGKENISHLTHCSTRLRFTLKNKELVDDEAVKKIEGVMGTAYASGQYQIIIGNAVDDAYRLICKENSFEMEADNTNTEDKKKMDLSVKGIVGVVFDTIIGSMTPLIPILTGAGLIKLIVSLGAMCGILVEGSDTYTVLSWVGDAGFYFMPIFVAVTTARKMGGNEFLAGVIGAALIHPTFTSIIEAGGSISIFGLPISTSASYTSGIIPALLSVLVMCQVEKLVVKISPEWIRSVTEPLLTLLITIPIALCFMAPLGSWISNYIIAFVVWLYDTFGFVGVAIFAAFQPLLVSTGMHQALGPYLVNAYATVGYEMIAIPGMIVANIDQGMAGLAVAIKTKNEDTRQLAISGALTALLGGITEPILYGINLRYKTPMIGVICGGLVGGSLVGMAHTAGHVFASSGLFALPGYIGPHTNNIILSFIGVATAMIVTFIVTFILYKDQKSDDQEENITGNIEVDAACNGKFVPMSEIPDPAFSQGIMGKCIAVEPSDGKIYSPSDGMISALFPTNHAVGITTKEGVELLLHIGIDTVNMNGEGFTSHVTQGQDVKKGDLLVDVDLKKVADAGYSSMVMHIVANSEDYNDFKETEQKNIQAGQMVMSATK